MDIVIDNVDLFVGNDVDAIVDVLFYVQLDLRRHRFNI